MTVVLHSDIAGDVILMADLGDDSGGPPEDQFEYWNQTAEQWQATPASKEDSVVTIGPVAALAGTPFANINRLQNILAAPGGMGTRERVYIFPYDMTTETVTGAPSSVSIMNDRVVTLGINNTELDNIKGPGFAAGVDDLDSIKVMLTATPATIRTDRKADHGTGSYLTATGFATPTNVTDTENNLKTYGDTNWTAGASTAGIAPAVPGAIEIPTSGTVDYIIDARTYDTNGDAIDADAAPTITLQNAAATRMESRLWAGSPLVQGLDSTPIAMFDIGVGHYRAVYRADAAHVAEQLLWQFDATITAVGYVSNQTTILSASTAVDFTAADRAKLDTLHDTRLTAARATLLDSIVNAAGVLAQVNAALDAAGSCETGVSLRQAFRAIAAAAAGETTVPAPGSGGAVEIKAIANAATPRITATVDASGNRTLVTPSL